MSGSPRNTYHKLAQKMQLQAYLSYRMCFFRLFDLSEVHIKKILPMAQYLKDIRAPSS
jgi:hypothetical protein